MGATGQYCGFREKFPLPLCPQCALKRLLLLFVLLPMFAQELSCAVVRVNVSAEHLAFKTLAPHV